MKRKLYKFSHSISQGGIVYAHHGAFENKFGLRNALIALTKKIGLLDPTVKVYDTLFFIFFVTKPQHVPTKIIEEIHRVIEPFGKFSEQYLFNGIYDVQEEYLKKFLAKQGFEWEDNGNR